MKKAITNGYIVVPEGIFLGYVEWEGGTVTAVGRSEYDGDAEEVYDACGKYVSAGSFVILTVVIIFAAIAVEKYSQFEKDSEMAGKAIGWYAAGALIAFILEMIIIFGFNSGFDVSRVVKPIMCIAITVYEFYMYFRARRLYPDDRGREEI